MRTKWRFVYITFFFWFLFTMAESGICFAMPALPVTDEETLPDSLLTDDYVYEYTFSDFDKAVQIMKELRRRDSYSQFRLDVTEGDLYFNTGRYLQALKYYKRVMESDTVRNSDKTYMEQVHRMISCYDCLHDEAKKARYVRLLLQRAEQCGNMEMKSVALFNMGKMVYYQEDKPRGYEMIKEAISLMKRTDYTYKYDNLRYDYNSLFIMQQRDKHYEDALQTLEELEKVVTEATSGEPGIGNLAEKERKTLYAHRAVVFSRLGRISEADEAYRVWKAVGEAYTKDDYLIIPYLMDRKRYDKVIEMYTPREAFLYANKDTINYHMMTVKRSLAKAYEGKGNYKLASRYYEALAILTDSLKAREQQSSAIELATVYETHEREAELQEQKEQVKMRGVLLAASGVVLVILLVLFVLNVRHTRIIRRKNTAMVTTIGDLLNYKDELDKMKEKMREAAGDPTEDACPAECEEKETTDPKEEEKNRMLFEELDSVVTRGKLFLNPDLSRDDFVKLTGLNKNKVGKILQQNTGLSTTGYINKKRLEYAAKLLKNSPDNTIQNVADACGLPNVPTFNRLFRSKFGMTPSEYRKLHK
ncbi:helix-turn-helix transcriptional regulator [Parabacteroides segnis]|uniref:helix-turn-helix domain-containing protein n=1 Tax=Parabacteroides segnis TaxID=2763058 RepID=UPI003515462E